MTEGINKISKLDLLDTYGIDLGKGKYSINYDGVNYTISNYKDDTDGCILVGATKGVNMIGNSRVQYAKLMTALKKAVKGEKIFIEIS
jgi:hypothetical protein